MPRLGFGLAAPSRCVPSNASAPASSATAPTVSVTGMTVVGADGLFVVTVRLAR